MPKKRIGTKSSSRSNKRSTSWSNNLSIINSPSSHDKSGSSQDPSNFTFLKKSSSVAPKDIRNETTISQNFYSEMIVPKSAAVHFGKFYGALENRRKNSDESTNCSRRSFTRQTVKKLTQSVGTAEYARQVSELLEETIEPADFKLNPPPAENTIPHGRQNPSGCPLWYKEPYKTTGAEENYKLRGKRHEDLAWRKKKIKTLFGDNVKMGDHCEKNEDYASDKSESDLSTLGSNGERTTDSEGADLESLSNEKAGIDEKKNSTKKSIPVS